MLAGFCVSESRADDAIDPRIEKAEQMLLGKIAGDQPVESRLDAVEMSLYGKTKHGSVEKRVGSISDFLGLKESKTANVGETKAESKSQATDAATNAVDPSASASNSSDVAKKTDAPKADALKDDAVSEAVKAAPAKAGLIQLKPQEAKMAMPPVAPKKVDSMPPAAPSIASTMSSNGSNSQARDLLREGLRQYSSSQYREAEATFRRVLTVDPRNADAFYNLGSLAEHNHDYVVALTNYRAALNFNPRDKDYIAAVTAMEHQLSASTRTSSASANAKRTVGHFQVPVDADTSSPSLFAGSPIGASAGQPFQLSGTQNDVLMNNTQFTNNNNYMPTMNVNQFTPPTVGVSQRTPPPTMGAAQHAPKKGSGLGKVMNVGMRAALYSSGLHCPVCRIMGGGFRF